jgi:hypothetical protein
MVIIFSRSIKRNNLVPVIAAFLHKQFVLFKIEMIQENVVGSNQGYLE